MENITSYTYDADDERYMVTFTRERDLSKRPMIDDLHGPRRVLAKLARFDGAYLRFTGQVKVQRFQSCALVEECVDKGIWELMYFGHAR